MLTVGTEPVNMCEGVLGMHPGCRKVVEGTKGPRTLGLWLKTK